MPGATWISVRRVAPAQEAGAAVEDPATPAQGSAHSTSSLQTSPKVKKSKKSKKKRSEKGEAREKSRQANGAVIPQPNPQPSSPAITQVPPSRGASPGSHGKESQKKKKKKNADPPPEPRNPDHLDGESTAGAVGSTEKKRKRKLKAVAEAEGENGRGDLSDPSAAMAIPASLPKSPANALGRAKALRPDRAAPSASASAPSSAFDGTERSLPFETDSADHAETPIDAYRHVAPLLDLIASAAGKSRATLRVYDPYFCDGSVISKLGSLGFKKVTNRCEDFYATIAEGCVPAHDVVVTNPPYSADHMERILRFCSQQNGTTPWLVLMPHFVYTKNYYENALGGATPFYIAPHKRYYYFPPSWTIATAKSRHRHAGNWTSPFPSFWYCHLGTAPATKQLCRHPPRLAPNVHFAEDTDALPDELRAELDPKKKRKNPKARKRAAKKRAAAAMGVTLPTAAPKGGGESGQPAPNKKKKRRF